MSVTEATNPSLALEDAFKNVETSAFSLWDATKVDVTASDMDVDDALRPSVSKVQDVVAASRALIEEAVRFSIVAIGEAVDEAEFNSVAVIRYAREKEIKELQEEWTTRLNEQERAIEDRASAKLARLDDNLAALAAEYGQDAANEAIGPFKARVISARDEEIAALENVDDFSAEIAIVDRRAKDRTSQFRARTSGAFDRVSKMIYKFEPIMSDFDALADELNADDGVDEFLRSDEIVHGEDLFMPMQIFKRHLKKFEEENGLRKGSRNTDKLRIALSKRGLKVAKAKKRYGDAELFRDYIKGIDRANKP